MVDFPAPVGGTVLPDDFAPSILFATLYACIVPLMVYRMFHRRSRCILLIGTVTFSIERVVIFALRAVQARNDSRRFSKGLTTYMQVSFGLGYIGIAADAVKLLRCLLVNATYGPETYPQSPAAASKGGVMTPPTAGTLDQPRVRFWSRRLTDFMGLAMLAATIPGIIADANYSQAFDSQKNADKTATNRIVSSSVVVALSLFLICVDLWSYLRLPRVTKQAVAITGAIYALVITVGIYRLSVMHIRTTSLSAPSVLNAPRAKAAFYVFHVLPEWLASFILLWNNLRKTFGTGLFGDWRSKDETEVERKKREEREAKRQEKKKHLVDTEKVLPL